MNLEIKLDEMAKDIAMRALDKYAYEGKTMREWIDLIKVYAEVKHDLISRSALLAQVIEKEFEFPSPYATGHRDAVRMIREKIYEAPAFDARTSDVVPVIRCKDCLMYDEAHGMCANTGMDVKPEFFCASASRTVDIDAAGQ